MSMRLDKIFRASNAKGIVLRPNEIAQGVEFPGEGKIAAIAEERHFENVEELGTGRVVNPFGIRVIVPEFPKKAADQRTHR